MLTFAQIFKTTPVFGTLQMKNFRFGALFLALFTTWTARAQHAEHGHDSVGVVEELSIKDEIKAVKEHHLKDSYSFHLWGDEAKGTAVEFPLPVILWDGQLHVFLSSAFHHSPNHTVESKGSYFTLHHSKIYSTDAAGTLAFDDHHHPTNAKPLDLSITKTVFSSILVVLLMVWLFAKVAKGYRSDLVPRGFSRIIEPLIILVRDDIARPNIGEKHYKRFMPYLLTVFFFIWIANLIGLMPFGINITGNIAVTLGLALITFILTQFSANKYYWGHIFWMPGVPYLMRVILAPIEVLGLIVKPFSLLIRLYANILAGHVVLMSIIGLMFVFSNVFAKGAFFGLTFFLSIIELLVAFLQAYIFTMLSALYFGSAVEEHAEHH
jgi:F-type H+-transporting ATPase subunit a